ncbi:MAG TPA: thiolase family protein [Thermoplasmata archaeon]|nr:thiolase family protein [Thermoplasmata archaeon]
MPAHAFLSAAHLIKFGKRPERLLELLAEAGRGALERAASSPPDLLVVGVMDPEGFDGQGNIAAALAHELRISGVHGLAVETAMSTGAAALHVAVNAVASGSAEKALVVAGEKMTHLPVPKVAGMLARALAPQERALGGTMPAMAAMLSRAYLEENLHASDDLACLAMKAHRNGAKNPFAHLSNPLTEKEYREARVISSPLRLFDIAPISDGACAVIVERKGDVRVAGIGGATDPLPVSARESLSSSKAMRLAGERAMRMAGASPSSLDVAEIHDAFTPFEAMASEDLGLFDRGGGLKAAIRGETDFGGKVVINPSGGLKARGHPVGASGLAQVCELYLQLAKQAGGLQVDGARRALAASVGGILANNLVTVLEAAS